MQKKIDLLQFKDSYVGAIGYAGLTYILMKAMDVVDSLRNDRILGQACAESTIEILELYEKNEICPARFDTDEHTVEWCQGCPGLIPLFALASSILPKHKARLLTALNKCGEQTW